MSDSLFSLAPGGSLAEFTSDFATGNFPVGPNASTRAGALSNQAETSPNTPQGRKLLAACQEFEGMLLTKWWEGMDKTFGDPTGEEADAGGETMRELGIESAANAIAAEGGMGLSSLMYKQLAPALHPATASGSGPLRAD